MDEAAQSDEVSVYMSKSFSDSYLHTKPLSHVYRLLYIAAKSTSKFQSVNALKIKY